MLSAFGKTIKTINVIKLANQALSADAKYRADEAHSLGAIGTMIGAIMDTAAVEEASSNVDELVSDIIDRNDLWAHRREDLSAKNCEFGSYMQYGNRLPDPVEEQARLLLSPAGTILVEHGFADSNEWEKRAKLQRYKYGVSWTEEQKQIMQSYGNKFSELYRLLEEKESLIANKKGEEVLRRWDEL